MKAPEGGTALALPALVEVELTRFEVSFEMLASLRPGMLLPLRMGATTPVTLLVEGDAFASAELVDIDGEVGARILEIKKRAVLS